MTTPADSIKKRAPQHDKLTTAVVGLLLLVLSGPIALWPFVTLISLFASATGLSGGDQGAGVTLSAIFCVVILVFLVQHLSRGGRALYLLLSMTAAILCGNREIAGALCLLGMPPVLYLAAQQYVRDFSKLSLNHRLMTLVLAIPVGLIAGLCVMAFRPAGLP